MGHDQCHRSTSWPRGPEDAVAAFCGPILQLEAADREAWQRGEASFTLVASARWRPEWLRLKARRLCRRRLIWPLYNPFSYPAFFVALGASSIAAFIDPHSESGHVARQRPDPGHSHGMSEGKQCNGAPYVAHYGSETGEADQREHSSSSYWNRGGSSVGGGKEHTLTT